MPLADRVAIGVQLDWLAIDPDLRRRRRVHTEKREGQLGAA